MYLLYHGEGERRRWAGEVLRGGWEVRDWEVGGAGGVLSVYTHGGANVSVWE